MTAGRTERPWGVIWAVLILAIAIPVANARAMSGALDLARTGQCGGPACDQRLTEPRHAYAGLA